MGSYLGGGGDRLTVEVAREMEEDGRGVDGG